MCNQRQICLHQFVVLFIPDLWSWVNTLWKWSCIWMLSEKTSIHISCIGLDDLWPECPSHISRYLMPLLLLHRISSKRVPDNAGICSFPTSTHLPLGYNLQAFFSMNGTRYFKPTELCWIWKDGHWLARGLMSLLINDSDVSVFSFCKINNKGYK